MDRDRRGTCLSHGARGSSNILSRFFLFLSRRLSAVSVDLCLFLVMSRPVIWPTEDVFFPVGNTAPICLTNYLPPEEDARVLLLGCGDPRNILYTLYESGSDDSNSAFRRFLVFYYFLTIPFGTGKRKMDFTCCDYEPAILGKAPSMTRRVIS